MAVQTIQIERHMMGRQLPRQVVELRRARAALEVAREGSEGPAAQNVRHERRQVATRSRLNKEANAVGVHGLNHPRELDARSPVSDGQTADRLRVIREWLAGRARIHWLSRRPDWQGLVHSRYWVE